MPVLSFTPAEIQSAISQVSQVGTPLHGGQRQVFPCMIGGQQYALKVMLVKAPRSPGGAGDDAALALEAAADRAAREVDIMSHIVSPHVVKMGPIDLTRSKVRNRDVAYFAEEWIDGEDLATILRRDRVLSIADVRQLGIDLAHAIAALWASDLVHRDIKPQNIMRRRDTGAFVLLDMGFVLDLNDVSLTKSGWFIGTPRYASPEQLDLARKRSLDCRSDMFSLGIVLYETATGQHPFWTPGTDDRVAAQRIRNDPPPPAPSTCRSEITKGLDRVIDRLLGKHPHLRYRDPEALIGVVTALR